MSNVKVVQGKNKLPNGQFSTYLDITNARLFKGKTDTSGHTPYYLDLVMMDKKRSQFGDWRDDQTHFLAEDIKKEERDAGVKGAILGNASDISQRRTNDRPPQQSAKPAPNSPVEDDEIPF